MKTCIQAECLRTDLVGDHCSMHYQRMRAGKDMRVTTCSVCAGPLRVDSKRGICKRNPECRKALNKDYFEDNKEELLGRQAQWYKDNAERLRPKQAEYRKNNPEKIADSKRRSQYGLARGKYEEMLAAQDGKCAGCGRNDVLLHVDHDHSCCPKIPTCGKCNRGLLCGKCNRAAGFVQDSPSTLRALADYLEDWERRRLSDGES